MTFDQLLNIANSGDPEGAIKIRKPIAEDALAWDVALTVARSFKNGASAHKQLDAAIQSLYKTSERLRSIAMRLEQEASKYADIAMNEEQDAKYPPSLH
jgi:hypothetical protein